MNDETTAAPAHDLVHVGFDGDQPIFKPKDGSTPSAPHIGLVYQHHDTRGVAIFAQPPRTNPHLQGMPHRLPLWEEVIFGVKNRFTSNKWPEPGWKPLCPRAEQAENYYALHRGDPRLPRYAWDDNADKLNAIREVAPIDETAMPVLAANEVERMTRSNLEPAADSKTTFPIAGSIPQPRITVRPTSRVVGGKYAPDAKQP